MKNYIGISRDHSGSMASLYRPATKDYNETIQAIKKAAIREGQDTVVSVVTCGGGGVMHEVTISSIASLQTLSEHAYGCSGNTPLFDSVGALIDQFEAMPDAKNPEVSFVVTAISDGEENASKRWSATKLGAKIRELQATDHWTFVFRVPFGAADRLARALNVPRGNIQEWEQTEQGFRASTYNTQQAYDSYYQARSMGATATSSFYDTSALGNASKAEVKKALHDVTSQVKFFDVGPVDNGCQIKDFIEQRTGKPLQRGGAFYALTKKENEVQDHKRFAVRDKRTKHVYSGVEARNILGLPDVGTVKLVPGDHGEFDLFVQSTSVNRKLVGGSQVMYWPNVGQP